MPRKSRVAELVAAVAAQRVGRGVEPTVAATVLRQRVGRGVGLTVAATVLRQRLGVVWN